MDTQNRAARKKYHVIYKTMCLVNEHYYIGMHSTDNLDDGYLGSGKRLWQSIKKHGKENHKYEILEHLPTREALRAREAELINVELITELNCMNIALGGGGGWEYSNANYSAEKRLNAGKAGGFANRHLWSDATKQNQQSLVTASNQTRWELFRWNNPEEIIRRRIAGFQASLSESARQKRKETFKTIGHSKGEKNSQFGTCWVYNQTSSKKIKKEFLEEYLLRGFIKGRNMGR